MPKRTPKLIIPKLVISTPLPIENDAWKRMEAVLDAELNPWAIDDIRDAVQEYILDADLEAEPALVADAIKELVVLRMKIGELRDQTARYGRWPKNAQSYARHLVNLRFDHSEFPDWKSNVGEHFYTLERLTQLLLALDSTCEICLQELDDPINHLHQGDAWQKWVIELTRAFKRYGLPITIRKDSEGCSPFVAFMRELQLVMPSEYRRHLHSDAALAAAINKARKQHRDE